MKKNILILLLLLTVSSSFAQYLVWTPETQTVSGTSGNIIIAKVTISCQGTDGQFASYFLAPCADDGGYQSIDLINGDVYVGSDREVTFKFKKPATSSSSSYTYTFKKDFGTCEDTGKISITVNYGPASCDYNPQVLNSVSSPNSITVNWSKDANVTNYSLGIKKSTDLSWGASVNIPSTYCDSPTCSYTMEGLLPSTAYNIRLRTKCVNGLYDDYIYLNRTTQQCSTSGPTNLNASPWNNGSWYISFTPVTGTTAYMLEYVDLVTNVTGSTAIFYSSSANEGNNLEMIPTGHNFKFRLQTPCSGAYSDWKTIDINCVMAPINSSNLSLTSSCGGSTLGHICGMGHFSWPAVTGADRYEIQYTIFNTSGQTSTGTFSTSSTSSTWSGMYGSGSAPFYIYYKIRSRCAANSNYWSDWVQSSNFVW